MHTMEESEHTWASVRDMTCDVNIFGRLAGVIGVLCFQPLIHYPAFFGSFIYCWRELFLEGRIFKDFIEIMVLNTFLGWSTMLVLLFNYVLRMEMHDNAYIHFNDVRISCVNYIRTK